MTNLLNITTYAFFENFGSLVSFPKDYTQAIFKKALSFLPDSKVIPNSVLVVHRERDAVYYIFISRIGIYSQDELFGLCVVTTNLMFTRLDHAFDIFEKVYRACYKNSIVVCEHPRGLKLGDLICLEDPETSEKMFVNYKGEEIRSMLMKEFENYPYIDKLPPVVMSEEADSSRTYFGFVNPNILVDSCNLGYVIIRKSVKYVSYVELMMPEWESEFEKCTDDDMLRAYLEKYDNETYNPYVGKAREALYKRDKKTNTALIVGKVLIGIGVLAGGAFIGYCLTQLRENKTDNPIIVIGGIIGAVVYLVIWFRDN